MRGNKPKRIAQKLKNELNREFADKDFYRIGVILVLIGGVYNLLASLGFLDHMFSIEGLVYIIYGFVWVLASKL